MPRLINPIEDEDLYDVITLGGVRSPGIVKISGHKRKVDWDIKQAKGQKRATTELKAIPLVEFTCEFALTDADDWEKWPAFLELINSTVAGPKPKALDIYHPDLAEQDIKSVVKAETQGTKHDGKGGQSKVVVFQEYGPPTPKGGAPTASKVKPENDPNAAAKAELAALTAQYQRTPWG